MTVQEGPTNQTKRTALVPAVLRNRDFARLFFAGVTSSSGFAIGQVALTWVVYAETNSAPDIALIGVSFILASVVFSLLAGAVVDRYERRKLMVVSDIIRAASLGGLVLWLVLLGFNLGVILLVAFILGSFTTLFQPAAWALTPEIVGSERLVDANALVQTTNSVTQFASNAAGGLLIVAVGTAAAFSLNAATFLVSALLIASVAHRETRPSGANAKSTSKASIVGEIRDGFRYIMGYRDLLELTLSAGLANLFFSMVTRFLVIYSGELLNGDAETYGFLLATLALGWAPGALLTARVHGERHAGLVWIYSGVADGALILLLVAFPSFILALLETFVLGLLLGFANTTWLTTVQLVVPPEMQGRYFGLDQLGSFATIPVGQVIAGAVIATSGITADFAIAGIGVAASSGLFIFSPYLRRLGWEPSVEGGERVQTQRAHQD